MIPFVDKSNAEQVIHILKWGKVMLSQLGEKTDSPVVLNRVYVRDDAISFAFIINKKKCSVTIPVSDKFPFGDNFCGEEVIVRSADVAMVTDYQHFIVGKTITDEPLFNLG